MKSLTTIAVLLMLQLSLFGQENMNLTFSGSYNTNCVKPDSFLIINKSNDSHVVLHWPDTVLNTGVSVDIAETPDHKGFWLDLPRPNPVHTSAVFNLQIPEPGLTSIIVTDIRGNEIQYFSKNLSQGLHTFQFNAGVSNAYFITARWKNKKHSIKIISQPNSTNGMETLNYLNYKSSMEGYKGENAQPQFIFTPGDELLMIGYWNGKQSGQLDAPENSKTYVFQFATNISCPGISTVIYEGQEYNTVQIYSQCWLKENMNVGTMSPASELMTNNGELEKYCYNDAPANCDSYGGLYTWWEAMQYHNLPVQGICPPGWHIPTDDDWKLLEGAVDSEFGFGHDIWHTSGNRGTDAGFNLKSSEFWSSGGYGPDTLGFSALPGGYIYGTGNSTRINKSGKWWTSTDVYNLEAWSRGLKFNFDGIFRNNHNRELAFSVRCLKDD